MTETIFIVEDVLDIDKLKNAILRYKDPKIFSINYFTHKFLKKNNIPHEIGESYLTDEDKKAIDAKSLNTTIGWSNNKTINEFLLFEGINLASLIELELLHYLLSVYSSAITITQIIQKEKPVIVVGSTYLNDFIRRICMTNNIRLDLLSEVNQPSLYSDKINIKFNLGNLPISFHIQRNKFLKIKKLVEKIINIVFSLNSTPNKKKSILLVDFNPVIYDILIKELSNLDCEILLLNQRRPAVWNLQSLKILQNSRCKIVYLEQFVKKLNSQMIMELNNLSNNLTEMWNLDHVFEEIFSINSQTFWHSIKNSFIEICNMRFKESIKRISLLNNFFDEYNISLILEWAETGQEEKEILHVAKKFKIKSVNLQHNLFSSSKMWNNYDRFVIGFTHPFLSDKQAIWDELTKMQALSLGHKEENLLLVGSPKHDKFFRNRNGTSKGIVLLATTATTNFSTEMSPFEAYLKFENFIKEVCRVVKELPDKQLLVKPHPQADYYTNITALIREIDPSIRIVYDANLVELINSCDVLITFNNSTIALESIILNKPTISLQFEKWAEEDKIVKMNAVMSISDVDGVQNGIKNLLYDEKIRNKYLHNAQVFLENFANRGSASKTLAEILEKL